MNALLLVSLKLDENANIVRIPINSSEISQLAKANSFKLIASVTNEQDPQRINRLLESTDKQSEAISQMINIMESDGYFGIDLDLENISEDKKPNYTTFVENLGKALKQKGYYFSLTLHAQNGELNQWSGSKGQDMESLAKYADEVRIMAYDIHTSETNAGSVIPLSEYKKIITYTLKKISVEKVIIALPTYGYDWSTGNSYSLQYQDIENLIKKHTDASVTFDPTTQSKLLQYSIVGTKHTVWFEDAETIKLKMDLAKQYGIYKFSFWRIGGEDEKLWSLK